MFFISCKLLENIRQYNDHTIVLINGIMMLSQAIFGLSSILFLLQAVIKLDPSSVFVYLWVQLINFVLLSVCVVVGFLLEAILGVYCFSNFSKFTFFSTMTRSTSSVRFFLVFSIYFWIVVCSYHETMRTHINSLLVSA